MTQADLFRDVQPSRKPGRPPIKKRAMTPTERQQRHRKRLAAEKAKAKHAPKRDARDARERQLAGKTIAASKALGRKIYGVIYADPPWRFEPYSRETGMDRAADNHYPTLTLEDIKALEVPAAPDCVLFLWATVPMLPQALDVMAAWGFSYRSSRFWIKPQIGTGYWARNRVEILLIGVRGHVPAPSPGNQPDQVVTVNRGPHSAKPSGFSDDIARLYPNVPKLEMFARVTRAGWDSWGNESAPSDESPGDSEEWLEQGAIGSYYAGIAEIGKRVHAGEPVPAFLLPEHRGAP